MMRTVLAEGPKFGTREKVAPRQARENEKIQNNPKQVDPSNPLFPVLDDDIDVAWVYDTCKLDGIVLLELPIKSSPTLLDRLGVVTTNPSERKREYVMLDTSRVLQQ